MSEVPSSGKLRSLFSLFEDSWGIYRGKFYRFLLILLLPVFFSILSLHILYFLSQTRFLFFPFIHFIFLIAIVLLFLLSSLSLLYAHKRELSTFEAYRESWKRFIPFLWLCFLSASIIIGGLIFALVPGILLFIWLSLVLPVFAFEGKNGLEVIARSGQLVKGRFWAILVRLLFIIAIYLLITLAISSELTIKIDYIPLSNLVSGSAFFLLQLFLLPLLLIYLAQIYEDLRALEAKEPVKKPKAKETFAYSLAGTFGMPLLTFLIALGIFVIFTERDIPPINDSDLVLAKVSIPREQNAYYGLMEALDKRFPPQGWATTTFWQDLFNDMLAGRRLLSEEASQLMASNEDFYRNYEKALRCPYLQIPELENPRNFTTITIFSSLSKMRELARWGVVRANYMWARGREEEALKWLTNVVKLGVMLENSPRPGGAFQYLVAKAIISIGFKPLIKMAGKSDLPPEKLRMFARELEAMAKNSKGLERAFRMEYMLSRNFCRKVEGLRYWKSSRKDRELENIINGNFTARLAFLNPWIKFLFLPNKTLNELSERYRKVIEDTGRYYKDMRIKEWIEEREKSKGKISIKDLLFKENP
ncbi:MAG: hypothetical protein ACPL7E_04720, partial [bacterium]